MKKKRWKSVVMYKTLFEKSRLVFNKIEWHSSLCTFGVTVLLKDTKIIHICEFSLEAL